MSYLLELERVLTREVIPDIEDRLDEIFEQIVDEKNATDEQKDEIEELREFKSELENILDDIKSGDIEEDECKEIIAEIREAQNGDEEE
ncbi:MAG: hypothetical protein JXQ66_01400 [Campylobacterales bacterium]|nr:hypothetical protein [Campylobacterales bacterium]